MYSSTLLCFKFTFLFFKVFLLQLLLCAPVVHCQPRHKAFKGVPVRLNLAPGVLPSKFLA